jgi:hypothetical protein
MGLLATLTNLEQQSFMEFTALNYVGTQPAILGRNTLGLLATKERCDLVTTSPCMGDQNIIGHFIK